MKCFRSSRKWDRTSRKTKAKAKVKMKRMYSYWICDGSGSSSVINATSVSLIDVLTYRIYRIYFL